jgi:proteasome lid subunit RPN8/RPN11
VQAVTPRPAVVITTSLLEESAHHLLQFCDAEGPHEGILYWAGLSSPDRWVITTIVLPKARTTSGSFRTSSLANAQMIAFLADHGLELLAQVHSHPGSFVGHSAGDITGALMPYENFLSIVVPHYSRKGLTTLRSLGIHRFELDEFRRLTESDVSATFKVLPTCGDLRV